MMNKEIEPLSPVIISPFSATNQPAVQQFCENIWNELEWPLEYMKGFDDLDAYFKDGVFLVAKDGEQVVGCGGVSPLNSTTGVMKRFYVSRELRGTGFSSNFLGQLLDAGRALGLSEIVLDVHYKNERAMQFYQKHGFARFTPEPNAHWSESQQPEIYRYFRLPL